MVKTLGVYHVTVDPAVQGGRDFNGIQRGDVLNRHFSQLLFPGAT